MKSYAVYILASPSRTLYIGITSDLQRRMIEHNEKMIEGFTKQYNVSKLVYFEIHSDIHAAIEREKLLKKWQREWKIDLIEKSNPNWNDLAQEWYEEILRDEQRLRDSGSSSSRT